MSSLADNAPSGRRSASLRRDDRGTVAVITAVAIIPLILSMGLAVDLTRAYMARSKLTAALDAAGLAVGANPSILTTGNPAALVSSYLQANFPSTNLVAIGTPTYTSTATTITLNATAQVTTTFMGLAGFSTVPVSAQSVISFAKSIEVAMVLDNTGSLAYPNGDNVTSANSNIVALKTAAGHFVVTLFGTSPTNNSQTRIGIVPYVAAVNAGVLASGLVQNPTTSPAYDASDVTKWTGCVVERATTFAAPLTRASVAADLDTPVGAGNYLAKYFWPQSGYGTGLDWTPTTIYQGPFVNGNTGGTPNATGGPNQSCPTPVVPMTSTITGLLSSIGADSSGNAIINQGMQQWQHGGTAGSIGMAWGYRMLSPNGPFAAAGYPVSDWNTAPWQKAVVLMTDGANGVHQTKNNSTGQSPYDYTGFPGPSTSPPAISTIATQEEMVCDALKAQHVIIYSIFLNSGSSPDNAISYCAGTAPQVGDPAYFYNAQNQTALFAAFQSIANSLTKLRITK